MNKIDELLTKLKEFKEIKLYLYSFTMIGGLEFYTKKKYKSEDGEEIERSIKIANVLGVKYILTEKNIVGTALIREELFLVDEYEDEFGDTTFGFIDVDTAKEYSFSKLDAMKKTAESDANLYYVDKNGALYGFYNTDENKKSIELLVSNGLIVEFNGKEKENGKQWIGDCER